MLPGMSIVMSRVAGSAGGWSAAAAGGGFPVLPLVSTTFSTTTLAVPSPAVRTITPAAYSSRAADTAPRNQSSGRKRAAARARRRRAAAYSASCRSTRNWLNISMTLLLTSRIIRRLSCKSAICADARRSANRAVRR